MIFLVEYWRLMFAFDWDVPEGVAAGGESVFS